MRDDERFDDADEPDRNGGLLDRRAMLKLTGGAAAGAAAFGLGAGSAAAAVPEDPSSHLDSAQDYNLIDFDGDWEEWLSNTHGGHVSTTNDHDRDGRAMRVFWPTGEYYGGTMEYHMLDHHGYQPDAGHVRYWIYFPDDWQFHDDGLGGTKLPGFAATYQTGDHDIGPGGYGGRPSDGTNGWSARMFCCRPDRNEYNDGPVSLGSQVYHAGDGGQYGAHPRWELPLETGTWHRIDQFVACNTPGEADGVYRGWVDGELAVTMDDLVMRADGYEDLIAIQTLWLNLYFGGDWGSPTDQHVLFDDFELWLWQDRDAVEIDAGSDDEPDDGNEDDGDDEIDPDDYEERFSYHSGDAEESTYRLYVDGEIVQYEWGWGEHNDSVSIETVEIDGTAYQVVDAVEGPDTWNSYYFNGEVVAISADPEPAGLWITGEQIFLDDYPEVPGGEDEADDDEEDADDGEGDDEQDDEDDSATTAPAIDRFDVTRRTTGPWARASVVWSVSDEDGALDAVTTELLADGNVIASEMSSLGGSSSSGEHRVRSRDRGGPDEVRLTVVDEAGNETVETKDY